MPALSIVIPAHNAEKTIGPLLESIFKQDFKDFEVLVVDDASSDKTPEIAKRYKVRYFRLDKNSGPARGRNVGAREALAERIVFFDSDVALKEGVLRKFYEKIADKNVKAVNGVYDKYPLNKGLVPLYKAFQEQIWFDDIKGDKVTVFNTSVGVIDKTIFMDLGGFNTKYKGAQVEDYDFSYRFAKIADIYLDRSIRVAHNFPYFAKLVKSYFSRAFLWAQLFVKNPRFTANGTTPRQAMVVIFYFFSVLALCAAMVFKDPYFLLDASGAFIFASFLDRKFIYRNYKDKGALFALYGICMGLFLPLVILSAVIGGFISAYLKKPKGNDA